MPVIALTQAIIKTLAPLPGKARTEWCDKDCPGLYIESRQTALNNGTYYLRYKDAGGTTRHHKLGYTNDLTLTEARNAARDKQRDIRHGADPQAAKKALKKIPTLREYCVDTYIPIIKEKNRAWKDDVGRLNYRILPALGDYPMNVITRKQIFDFHLSLKQSGLKGATADLHLALIKRMYAVAVDLEIADSNPAAKVALFRDPNEVENILNEEQLRCLFTHLMTHKKRLQCQLIIFLLATGVRISEAKNAIWGEIDIPNRRWTIGALRNKGKRTKSIALNDTALAILEALPKDIPRVDEAQYVFVHAKSGKRIRSIQRLWESLKTSAGVPFLRMHDLRHMYASFLINSGKTLYEVQKSLQHREIKTTARYAHLSTKSLQDAAASASASIQAVMPRLLPSPDATSAPTAS